MKFQAKSVRRPVLGAAATLLGANVGLALATGHHDTASGVARPVVIAAVMIMSTSFWMWVLGRKLRMLNAAYRALLGAARKMLGRPTFQVAVGGWAVIGWTGTLASNIWTTLRGRSEAWLAPQDAFADPGRAFAAGGGVLGVALVLGAVVVTAVVASRKARNRPGKNDVHETSLERLLAPTMGEVEHLRVDTGSIEEVTRPYLGDALVRRERLGGLLTTHCMVPLYLSDAAAGLGVFGPPGMGKGANTVANTVLRPGGQRTAYDDGFGLGYLGPQILISNTAEIASSIRWRVAVARAALRQGTAGTEPTHEEIRSLVTVYDPTGVGACHPDLAPYRKGWSPLDGVSDRATAKKLAEGLLAGELSSTTTNSEFFAKAAVRLVTAFLLAAHRVEHPLGQVAAWADEIQHADSRVPTTLARILKGADADAEDALAYDQFFGTYVRLRDGGDGERSAVWGTLEKALEPFTTVAIAASTNPAHNEAMVDSVAAVTRPYAVTFVIMPSDPHELVSTRPVFTAFLEDLLNTAVKEAARYNPMFPTLPFPLLVTADESENCQVLPRLDSNLASFRKYNVRIQWITQTYNGLSAGFSDVRMGAITGNSGAVLTYAGYGATDDHLKHIVEEIGARTITKISRSKRRGERDHDGESESKDRVQLVDVARLKSELRPDQMILQTAGASRGTNAGREQLRPFVIRQHRAVASKVELQRGWWVDPVTNARLVLGTAAGVAAKGRPTDRRWLRPVQRVCRSLAMWARRRSSVPAEA